MLDKDTKIVTIALTLVILILGVLFVMDRSGSRDNEQQETHDALYKQTESVDPYSGTPYDHATVMTTTVDLNWRAGSLATSHTVYLHQNEDWVTAGDPKALLTETQDTTVKAVELAPGCTYYWRVDAVNPKEPNSPWAGDVWHFRIPPNQAFDLYPPEGATNVGPHTKLTWKPAANAVGYRLAWGTDAHTVANNPGEELTLSTTSYEPMALNLGTTYTWRVDTVTPDSVIAGQLRCFTVVNADDPGTDNLTHHYSFESGTQDLVAGVDGALVGDANVVDGALVCDGQGDWMELDGAAIDINSYAELTLVLWAQEDVDNPYSGTVTFGSIWDNGTGKNYLMLAVGRGDDINRIMIANTPDNDGPWNDEIGVDSPEIVDSMMHQYVCTVTAKTLTYYVDGSLIGSVAMGDTSLAGISNDYVYLGKGIYNEDPTWRGLIGSFSIYNKALTYGEVVYTYDAGE